MAKSGLRPKQDTAAVTARECGGQAKPVGRHHLSGEQSQVKSDYCQENHCTEAKREARKRNQTAGVLVVTISEENWEKATSRETEGLK